MNTEEELEKSRLEIRHLKLLCSKLRKRFHEIKEERDDWKKKYEFLKAKNTEPQLEDLFKKSEERQEKRRVQFHLEQSKKSFLKNWEESQAPRRAKYKKKPDEFPDFDDEGNPVKPKSFMEELESL